MKRRTFLASTTVLLSGCSGLPVIPKRPLPNANAALSWISHTNGQYTLRLMRAEMGQHIDTSLLLIAAEELGVNPEAIQLKQASTRDIALARATVGSESIGLFALPLARACATLREAIAAGQTGTLKSEEKPISALRAFAPKAKWVGPHKTAPAVNLLMPSLLRGEARYAADIRRPNQLFGRVLRAPSSPDIASKAATLNEAAVRALPGLVALVRDPLLTHGQAEGIGIVASTPGALDRIEQALAIGWTVESSFETSDIEKAVDVDLALKEGGLSHRIHNDRLPEQSSNSSWTVDLRIDVAAAAHAGIEPRCAVAEFNQDHLSVWCGHQDPFYVRAFLAKRLKLNENEVVVHNQRIGGAFGGRTICNIELDAAVLARAVRKPVKVQWTRAQEWQQGFHRPPSSHRVRAQVKDGKLQTWWHCFVSAPILLTNAAAPVWLHTVTNLIGDGGTARGAKLVYDVPVRRTEYSLRRLPLYCGPWRGLGAAPNGLVVESAIDESALRSGLDPLEFRLSHLSGDTRLSRVLTEVAKLANWRDRSKNSLQSSQSKRHLGIACGVYKETSRAAIVAEVALVSGRWKVTQMWCVWEGGFAINPDSVKAQCEGNMIWGLGMVFGQALPIKSGGVNANGLVEADLPKLSDIPKLHVELLSSDDPPAGAGETAIVASAAAIANALRSALGVRLSSFPVNQVELASMQRKT